MDNESACYVHLRQHKSRPAQDVLQDVLAIPTDTSTTGYYSGMLWSGVELLRQRHGCREGCETGR